MDIIYLSDDENPGGWSWIHPTSDCTSSSDISAKYELVNNNNIKPQSPKTLSPHLQLPTSFVIPMSPNKYDQRTKSKSKRKKKKKSKELPSKRTEADSSKLIKFMIESSPLI